jgi:hypothetical protein
MATTRYDPVRGRLDFENLGALTDRQLAVLAAKPTDHQRRLTLHRWFGHHGGVYAWRLYSGLDTTTYRRPRPTPDAASSRQPHGSE